MQIITHSSGGHADEEVAEKVKENNMFRYTDTQNEQVVVYTKGVLPDNWEQEYYLPNGKDLKEAYTILCDLEAGHIVPDTWEEALDLLNMYGEAFTLTSLIYTSFYEVDDEIHAALSEVFLHNYSVINTVINDVYYSIIVPDALKTSREEVVFNFKEYVNYEV